MLSEDINKNLEVAKPDQLKERKMTIALKVADALLAQNEDEQEKWCPLYRKVSDELKKRSI